MRYVTTCELNNIIRKNLAKIPHDVDLVVGVPRSGMLPATMIALALNVRLADVDSFAAGRTFDVGERCKAHNWGEIKKVLVVDDSVHLGGAINKAKNILAPISHDYQLIYLAVIASTIGIPHVDMYFEVIDELRVFEWNLFHHFLMGDACLDIDGVLNEDPVVDDDGPIYMDFLKNAMPLNLPTVEVNTLISCRLEKYRTETEQWLSRYGVRYKNLILLDMPDKKTRVQWGKHGEYKAEYFAKSNCSIFIESSLYQAKIISELSKKPVICIETNELIMPRGYKWKNRIKRRFPSLYSWLKHFKKNFF